jgi:16S rRNA (cytidine1402-2'-O)-methyltransferase
MEAHGQAVRRNDSATGPCLYVVATPIGNLEDITLRALRVLKEVDLIACEDTRQTRKLLDHYGIQTRTISYHEHNEMTRAAELIVKLEQGGRLALVSDAGMPSISDPGYRLITLAIRHHVPVIPIPGASAFVAALAASGLPTDSFKFNGFLPVRSGERRDELEKVRDAMRTIIYYEAPHRILETLEDVVDIMGGSRHVVVAREVTKLHEEFLRGRADEVLEQLRERGEVKGEITLLIGRATEAGGHAASTRAPLQDRLQEVMADRKLDEKAALKVVAKEMGVSRSEAYRELQRIKR